jgi:hypothetical protein
MRSAFESWVVALADAARGDDGPDGVVAVMRSFLADHVSFEAGEVRWLRPTQPLCWPLTEPAAEDGLVADDVVAYAAEHEAPLRIDDRADARSFPRTHERLRRREQHSVLVLPLLPAGAENGAVVLVRAERCGFAGTSFHQLAPLVRVGGVCLDLALRLTTLRREVAVLRPASGDALKLQQSLHALHDELVAVRRARDAAEARCRVLETDRD